MSDVPTEGETAGYQYTVTEDAEDGFVIEYPDLPGCITQVETAGEISAAAEEIRVLWLETTRAADNDR